MHVVRVSAQVALLLLSLAARTATADLVPRNARTDCALPALSIAAPARAHASQSGLSASVPSNAARGYVWKVTNGEIDFGQGTHAIRFRVGEAGPATVEVFELDETLCASPTARASVAVDPLPDWFAPSTFLVPIVLSSTGEAGSFFTSELTLANRGTTPATVTYAYTAAFGGGSGTAQDVVLPGRQKVVPDAIGYLRDRGVPLPLFGNRGGTLRVRFDGLSTPGAAAVSVRTTTPATGGRAGLAYPGFTQGAALTRPAWIFGLRQTSADRSNVAVLNAGGPADGPVTLRLTVHPGDPGLSAPRPLPDMTLPPGGFYQASGLLAPLGLSSGFVRVERLAGTAPYFAYGVVNDSANSDGSFVPPVPEDSGAAAAGLTLPVAVETARFESEVVLANASPVARRLRLAFVADAVSAPSNEAAWDVTLAPFEQRVVPSFVEALRSAGVPGVGPRGTTFVGPVFVRPLDGRDVSGLSVSARTSSPGGGGRFGLFYAALPDVRTSAPQAWLFGLRQNGETRTNLALLHLGDRDSSDARFTVELFDGATGALARTLDGIVLGPRRFLQIDGVLASGGPPIANAYARVTRTGSTSSFQAYAVVNDGGLPGERTGDGAYVAATTFSGRALLRTTIRIPAGLRSALEELEDDLEAKGARLTAAGLETPAGTPMGFWSYAGEERAMSDTRGAFAFLELPPGTLGEVRSPSGTVRQTFPLSRVLSSEAWPAEPIEIGELWDGPLGMNQGEDEGVDLGPDDGPGESTASATAHGGGASCHAPPKPGPLRLPPGPFGGVPDGEPTGIAASFSAAPGFTLFKDPVVLGVCPGSAGCQDVTAFCQTGPGCCLDYDGLCGSGQRWAGCALRYTVFIGST
jgi:hypothetical protein